jgi:beta-1,4-mannooligosaccharide/beta-1,4-mannosyl-N-acetylglucosamine phosphorylase
MESKDENARGAAGSGTVGTAAPSELPNIPWEDRPADSSEVLWRSSRNPIIKRDQIARSNSIFNSAVVPFGDGFAGVFRVDDTTRVMNIHAGFSRDGVDWNIEEPTIEWAATDERVPDIQETFVHAYDPRVTWLEDRFYVTWCNGYYGPTIGVGYTHDFKTFHQLDNAFLPFNRNGVLFPRRVNGTYLMLSRPSDNGHTAFGDIYLSESPDLVHWGRHRRVMTTKPYTWESTKVGAGPTPIETPEGWLLIYHGVLTSCNGYVYSMGAALLDLDEPWKVIARSRDYLLSPQVSYEQVGDVQNVTFPCAALVDGPTGRVTIYYGAADTVTCLAHGYLPEILEFVKDRS